MHPVTTLMVGLQWVVTYLVLHHLALWWTRRDQRVHLWVAAWCMVAASHQGGRVLHYGASDPEAAVFAVRVATAAVALSGVVGIGAIRSLVGVTAPSWIARGLMLWSGALAALVVATPWFFSSDVRLHVDPVGRELLWVEPGHLQVVWIPWGLACLAYALSVLIRAEGLAPIERRLIGAAMVVYVAGGLVDSLVGLGLLRSILLFEFAFGAIAVGFDWLSIRRFSELRRGLEDRVQDRTAELRSAVGLLGGALEEAHEATAARSEFLANVSHEVRTPLNGLLGMTQLLARTELDPLQRQMVQTAQSSAESVLDIVNDVLDLSKVEAGGITLEEGAVDFADAVEQATSVFAGEAQRRGLEIVCLVPEMHAWRHQADAQRVGQVIRNLLGNALKFTPKGRIVVELQCDPLGPEVDQITISVSDTGIGIERGDQERIFDAFTQVDGSSTRAHTGTGLGLTIGRRLAELMGGSLSVSSAPETGSRFELSFPATRARMRRSGRAALRGFRGLLVGPSGVTREAVARQLRSFGVEVTAVRPQSALRSIRSSDVDLVVVVHSDPAGLTEWLRSPAHAAVEEARLPQALLVPVTHAVERSSVALGPRSAIVLYPAVSSRLVEAIRAIAGGAVPGEETTGSTPRGLFGLRGTRVLVVEDNRVNQEVARGMLEELGLSVHCESGGEAAVELALGGDFAVVLMDCQMPGMDGYTATRLIRQQEEPGQHLPILAMTAHAMPEQRRRCADAGMDGFLSKPVRLEQLEDALLPWLYGDRELPVIEPSEPQDGVDLERARLVVRLIARRGLDPAHALLEPFEAGRHALRTALEARDDAGAREAAHTLAGAAANLGATQVADGCRELGLAVKAGDRWAAASAADEVEVAMDRALSTLQALLSEPPAAAGP